MSFSQTLADLLTEVHSPANTCNACERQGLPILPLRRAVVPDTRPGHDSTTQTRMGLRTLRSGYLYVLLDQRIWHAYEVTQQGHLRRFNPYEPSLGSPRSLPERCIHRDHDIPSSFLNIDTETYGSAWLAFSSDAWPTSVLDAYRSGEAPAHRFEGLDLLQARTNPELLGLAMTPENLQVDRQVFEYAQQLNGPFDSAHGFHSRFLRKTALRGYLNNSMTRHQLRNGVLAVVLDDTVGLIQEYNHQRLNWIVKRQTWREEPLRAYQFQTSQILQIIRATHRDWAAQEVPRYEPQTGDGPPSFVDPEVERQRVVEMRQNESDQRLEERYDEPRRAAFQHEYEQEDATFQAHIDSHAGAYVKLCESAAFTLIERHDYDGRDRESGIAYSRTMATCLAGGITEAPPSHPETVALVPGTSEALWLKWLQDPNSPPYRALLLRDQALLAALLPSFSQTEPNNWNDSEKLYAALSKFIASEDAGLNMRDSLKQAITELQGSVNAASQRLQAGLAPGVQHAVRHLNSASQRIYNGVHLIELQVQMKLGEYYALQSAHLRELQNNASEKLAKARERMVPSLDELMAGVQDQARKVKPIIQTGLLSLAVLDPKIAHQVITVSVWVEGTGRDLHERLAREVNLNVNQLSNSATMALVEIKVAAGTLEPHARKALDGMRISAQQASKLARNSFTGLRGTGKSWELLLALGGLYLLNDSLLKSLKKVEEEIGSKSNEAMMALYGSSLAIIGGGIELSGHLLPSRANTTNKFPIGRTVAHIGAIVSAVAGIFDTLQAYLGAKRTSLSGDDSAFKWYRRAIFSGMLATGAAIVAVFQPLIIGPLGIAIISGFITLSLFKIAGEKESTSIEKWLKRCYFGYADETPRIHWNTASYADIALSELNAATLGLNSGLTFRTTKDPGHPSKIGGLVSIETKTTLQFSFRLPQFDECKSSFHWVLIIHRSEDGCPADVLAGEVIVDDTYHVPAQQTRTRQHSKLTPSKRPKIPDYIKDSLAISRIEHRTEESHTPYHYEAFSGTLALAPEIGRHNVVAATLSVAYWPDRNIPDAFAEAVLQENNA